LILGDSGVIQTNVFKSEKFKALSRNAGFVKIIFWWQIKFSQF